MPIIDNWNFYIRKYPVLAIKMKEKFSTTTFNNDKIYGYRGDYICITHDKKYKWVESSKNFGKKFTRIVKSKQYNKFAWNPYKNRFPVEAKKINKKFILKGGKGNVVGKKGDYLCRNKKKTEVWIMPAFDVENYYMLLTSQVLP